MCFWAPRVAFCKGFAVKGNSVRFSICKLTSGNLRGISWWVEGEGRRDGNWQLALTSTFYSIPMEVPFQSKHFAKCYFKITNNFVISSIRVLNMFLKLHLCNLIFEAILKFSCKICNQTVLENSFKPFELVSVKASN